MTVAPSTPVTTKLPYWAPTAEEMQAAQAATTPSRSLSRRLGRKNVAASKATPTPTPAQAIPRKPVPTPTTPTRRFSYDPVVGNPYAEPVAATRSRNPLRAAPATNNRSSSPPYVPGARAQSPEQLRPLSPGSIFANGGTPPAPHHARKGSFAAISRGVGSLKKAASTFKKASSAAKQALTPQHELKISSPIAGSFQRGLPPGHVLAQEELAPLNLVGLEVAQADTARYGQAAFQFATGPGAGETARITATRADAYKRLTGEAAPANLGSPSAPSASTPASLKKPTPRKVVNSTFGGVIDAGMDVSWASNPRDGKVSTPTDTPPPQPTNNLAAELNPFTALGSAAQMFKKQGQQANQPLPSTSVAPAPTQPAAKPLAPKPLATSAWTKTPAQWASEAPPVPGTDFTQDLRDRRASQMMRVTCAKCSKVTPAVAIAGHRCAKPPMTEERKQEIRNMRISKMFPPSQVPSRCVKMGEWVAKKAEAEKEVEAPEVFLDTYVQAAQTVWRSVTRL